MSKRPAGAPPKEPIPKQPSQSGDEKFRLEDLRTSFAALRTLLQRGAANSEPPHSHSSYVEDDDRARQANKMLEEAEDVIGQSRETMLEAIKQVALIQALLGVSDVPKLQKARLEWPEEELVDACRWLDRDSLDSLQLTSRQFREIVARNEFTALALRFISAVHLTAYCCSSNQDHVYVSATIRHRGPELVRQAWEGNEVIAAVLPYMRASFCEAIYLEQGSRTELSVDLDATLAAFCGVQGTVSVGHAVVTVPDAEAGFFKGIVGSLRSLGTLEVAFTEIHPDSFDDSFFRDCVAKGATEVTFTLDRHYYEEEQAELTHTTFMDVTPFCFAEAVSGTHRRIDGRYANGPELIQTILQRSAELRAPASQLRFTIADVPNLSLDPLEAFEKESVSENETKYAIKNVGCGLPAEIVVAVKPDSSHLRDVMVRIG